MNKRSIKSLLYMKRSDQMKKYKEEVLDLLTGYPLATGRMLELTPQPLQLKGCALKNFEHYHTQLFGRDKDYLTIEWERSVSWQTTGIAIELTPREWDLLLRGYNPWDNYCLMYHHHDTDDDTDE